MPRLLLVKAQLFTVRFCSAPVARRLAGVGYEGGPSFGLPLTSCATCTNPVGAFGGGIV